MGICETAKKDDKNMGIYEAPKKDDNIKINKYLTQICKSICLIKIYEPDKNKLYYGTGFLIKFDIIKGKPFFCLMTNEHVLKKEFIESKKDFDLYFDFEKQHIRIKLDRKERIIKDYKFFDGEKLDITILEILEADNIDKDLFLSANSTYFDYNNLVGKRIYIPQYPVINKKADLRYSEGKIVKISNKYEILHEANTKGGSSGSPIFLENTTEVIGIHKAGLESTEVTGIHKGGHELLGINYGSFIYPIINLFRKKGMYDKFRCEEFEGIHKYTYIDGEYYEGEWKNGLRHGKGKLIRKDGTVLFEGNWINDGPDNGKLIIPEENDFYYIGEFNENVPMGKGKGKIYKNGELFADIKGGADNILYYDTQYYIGEIQNFAPNGKGKLYNKDGTLIYEGDFVNYHFQGYGKGNLQKGFYYIGEWRNSLRNGKGKMYNKEGKLVSEGYWVNDYHEGFGKIIYENELYYIGEIKKNKKHGKGKLFDEKGKLIYFGDFVEDKFEGKGFMILEDNKNYIGSFKNNHMNGKGTVFYKNQPLYDGEFVDGKCVKKNETVNDTDGQYIGERKNNLRHGKGTQYYANGNIHYEGDWINDKMEGFGKLYNNYGDYYIGEFKNNLKNGKGKQYLKDGSLSYEGDWVNDKLEGYGELFTDISHIKGEFKNNQPYGKITLYNNNGDILFDGNFEEMKNIMNLSGLGPFMGFE